MRPKGDLAYLKSGSKVEVSIDDDGFCDSWFSATIIYTNGMNRFLVKYHNLIDNENNRNPLQEFVCLHQLRPLPPPQIRRDFKSGDIVDAFHNDGWWEGRVTRKYANGSFSVYFPASDENIVFSKDQLRTHCNWINHNWVFPITNHKVSVRGKESEGRLVVKRQRREERDEISELPDSILIHMMSFMETKDAVKTCVLSKRWKDLCKCLSNLTLYTPFNCKCKKNFRKFASWVLSSRDESCSLFSIDIRSWTEPEVLDKFIEYIIFHSVKQVSMYINLSSKSNLDSLHLVFCSKTLTSLRIGIMNDSSYRIVLPKSLHLPALIKLYIENINFTAIDNDYAEPFSNCRVLEMLFIENCQMHDDAKVLRISNSTLSNLQMSSYLYSTLLNARPYGIELSTPSLSTFTIKGFSGHQLSSSCNLPFLGPVTISVFFVRSLIIARWLQLFANVKILSLTWYTIRMIHYDFSNLNSMTLQPPCFPRLETLKLKIKSCQLSDEEVKQVVEYLLQNSPNVKVDVIINR